jgi:predicted HNH restriction endonuclease
MVSRGEMDDLMRYSADYDTIMKKKVSKLMANKPQILANKSTYAQNRWTDTPQRVQYKITDLSELNNKVLVTVTVDDAGKMEGRKYIPSNGGYLKGEVPGITKETIENLIKSDVNYKLSDFIGDKKNKNIEINIIHSKE